MQKHARLVAIVALVIAVLVVEHVTSAAAAKINIALCGPKVGLSRENCAVRRTKCWQDWKIRMVWSGLGYTCGGKHIRAGCQCGPVYCGWLCKNECETRSNKQCVWSKNVCRRRSDNSVTLPVKICPSVGTPAPSRSPSRSPSKSPTKTPSKSPTKTPSKAPTRTPSKTPSESPSKTPSQSPSKTPSQSPSRTPSKAPEEGPSVVGSCFFQLGGARNGNLGTRASTTNDCNAAAVTAGITCTSTFAFVAFNGDAMATTPLNTRKSNAVSACQGLPFFSRIVDQWADLFDSGQDYIRSPRDASFFSIDNGQIWTGMNADGTASVGTNCNGFTTTSGSGHRGHTNQDDTSFIYQNSGPCNSNQRVLCVCVLPV